MPITTKVASLNPANYEVYSIQHYVMKFVSDFRQVGYFLLVLRFPQGQKSMLSQNLYWTQKYNFCKLNSRFLKYQITIYYIFK
jgi:hypothetical protein